ncbi:hypothetical protein [Amycolatopsis cihanbeyliensis]|uniref:Anti-sigma-M factor RsmA n=1 Tax=Amycolatopsis cihanbeyliensis TaxID=1128664 RepID=A0A542DL89_AMYCI|nr:hypothetical protein [Amycolatopsis cihanbeyliensis]TQJ03849.1 hypothetical protein FB471_3619 [Amycolatopsis cihanbeyliensis]
MTDEQRGTGEAVGPPWSVDVLADLHAGVLDEGQAARLWPRVNADPEARAIIESLEATTTDLSELNAAPIEPMPAEVAARIDAALAEEVRQRGTTGTDSGSGSDTARAEPGVAPVVSIDAARRRRNRMLGWGGGVLTAAAAAVAALAIVLPGDNQTPGSPDTGADPGQPPVALQGDALGAAIGEVEGVRDFGAFGGEQELDACLAANGIDPDRKAEGIRPATIDGREAVIVLYTTGELAQFRLVAVPPTCGPGNPELLVDEIIGGTGG